MDDFDDLLARLNALHHLRADGFGFDPVNEIPRHLEIHVRLEQRHAHVAQRLLEVRLAHARAAAQALEGRVQLVGQLLEHRS